MKKLLIFTLFFSVLNSNAAIPTMEGLFRNANNPPLNGNFVVAKFLVEEVKDTALEEEKKISEASEQAVVESFNQSEKSQYYVKLIFSLEKEGVIQLLQVVYNDHSMKNDSIVRVSYLPDVVKKTSEDAFLERGFLFSLLTMFLTNNSESISNILKRIDPNFKTNQEVLNKEKVDLFEKYKNYLTVVKTDETIADQLESPMKPANPEEQKKVDELMKLSMYKPSGTVKLIKENDTFYWRIGLDNISAFFSNKKHQLERIEVTTAHGGIRAHVDEFILFDGIHELPVRILYKDTTDKLYKIRTLSLKNFTNKGDNLIKRLEKYNKMIDNINKDKKEAEGEASQAPTNNLFFY